MSQRKAKGPQRPLFRIRARHRKDRRNARYCDEFLNTLFSDTDALHYATTRTIWPWVVMEVGRPEPYGWDFATPYMDQSDNANDFSPEPPEDRDAER